MKGNFLGCKLDLDAQNFSRSCRQGLPCACALPASSLPFPNFSQVFPSFSQIFSGFFPVFSPVFSHFFPIFFPVFPSFSLVYFPSFFPVFPTFFLVFFPFFPSFFFPVFPTFFPLFSQFFPIFFSLFPPFFPTLVPLPAPGCPLMLPHPRQVSLWGQECPKCPPHPGPTPSGIFSWVFSPLDVQPHKIHTLQGFTSAHREQKNLSMFSWGIFVPALMEKPP